MNLVSAFGAAALSYPLPHGWHMPNHNKFTIVSVLSTAYALTIHIFRIAGYESEVSLAMVVDVMSVAACVPAAHYAGHLLPGWSWGGLGGQELCNAASYLSALVSLYLARRMYTRLVVGNKFRPVRVDNKVYIITGSNTGLGYETAREIVKLGGVVVMACRTLDKARAARETLLAETLCWPEQLMVLHLDLNSFSSVRHFVADFAALKLSLHCLINNAGLMMSDRNVTEDGLEMVFTANHLSAFLLTSLLLPLLEEGAETYKCGGRIINVSSSLHKIPRAFNFDDVMSEKRYELFSTYAQSKLANVLFTLELHRRLSKKKKCRVATNCVHPGFVRTEVTRHMNAFLRIGNELATPIMLTLQKTPPQGAYCTVHTATAPELEGHGGKYFANCLESSVGRGASSEADAARLWALSEKLTATKWDL